MAEGVAAPSGGNITEADEDVLMDFAKKMDGPLQILEGHIDKLGKSQGALQSAFKGNAGNAVYNAFGNVLTTGAKVADYIEQIMQMILSSRRCSSSSRKWEMPLTEATVRVAPGPGRTTARSKAPPARPRPRSTGHNRSFRHCRPESFIFLSYSREGSLQ
ncbi:MAG: hypothetical protein HOQ44_14245 [Nocardia sp.]|nr:hypothetical protein [Nocardia sp.]